MYIELKIGEWMTIRSNTIKNTFQMKFNGKMYYREVSIITNCSWRYEPIYLDPLGNCFYKNENSDEFCGTDIYSTKISF